MCTQVSMEETPDTSCKLAPVRTVEGGQPIHPELLTSPRRLKKRKKREKEPKKKDSSKLNLCSLFRYASKVDILILLLGLTFSIIHGAMFPVLALVFGQMTDIFIDQAKESGAVLSSNDASNTYSYNRNLSNISGIHTNFGLNNTSSQEEFIVYLANYALNYLYIGLGVLFAAFIQTLCLEISCERQVFQMRRAALTQMLRQDISWYDTRQNTNLTNILSDDVERVREGIGCKFSMVTQYLSTFVCGTLVGFAVNWKLTAVLMIIAPFLIAASAYLAKLTAGSAAREQLKYGEAGAIAAEALACISTVAAFSKETQEIYRYDQALEKGRMMAMKKYTILAWGLTIVFFLMYGQYAVAFYYGAQLIDEGYCSPGSIFTVFFSVLSGAFTLGNALPYVNSVATAFGSASAIFHIIDRTPKIDTFSKAGLKLLVTKGYIQFQNVSFSYASRPDVQVLQGLNLDIQPGKTTAFVGPSGCGKSTIVRLFLRFYDVDGGQILLDGRPLKDLNLNWLRAQVGVVWQEPVLFDGSIADNIRHGREEVTQDEIEMAATMANVHAFIDGLPQGYETQVGDNGAQLSGGQKQRIAIARALVRDPAILLLDEATSALDLHSESVVQDALERAMLGRTTVIIAHRLSTIRHADLIYTLNRGKVAEQGNHAQLMQKRGLYYQLVNTQAIFNTDEGYLTDYVNHSLIPVNHLMQLVRWGSIAYSFQPLASVSENGISLPLRPRPRLTSSAISIYQPEEDPFPEGEVRKVNMKTLVKMHQPECSWLLLGILGSSISGAIMPIFAFFYGEVFATFTKTGKELQQAAIFWSCMFLVLGVLAAVSIWLEVVTMTEAVERMVLRLRSSAFQNILCQPVGWFDLPEHSSGRLTSQLARDAPLIKGAAGLRLGQMMSASVTLLAALTVAFVFGWKLAFVLLLVVPLVAAGAYHQTAMVRQTQDRDSKLIGEAGRTASECVRNICTVQAFGLESHFVNLYMESLRKPYREAKKQALWYSITFSVSQAVIYVMYAGAFRFGAYLIEIGDMTSTEVYRVFFALAFCAASVGASSAYVQDFNKAKLAARQIFALIDRKSEIDTISPYGLKPQIKGLVRFDSVYFHYPTRPDVQVFRGLTLMVAPGQTLAVIGQSGCGKSTILALLQRFYIPSSGSVTVDETNIQDINVHHLRKQIGLVTQEPVLFNRTIRENIAYGLSDDLSTTEVMTKVIQAARLANCHSFITQLPEGYETQVGAGGSQLSGGQKQRIAIARALVRDPRILLLDEATSALDTKNEEMVQAALDNAREGRTCIIIAHRLSTIQSADLIAVLDQGKIREVGSHEELRRKKGLYYKLIKAHSL